MLRGVPKEAPPEVPGVSLKWDEQAGGFIFPRAHASKVQAAVDGAPGRLESLTVAGEAGGESNPDQITDPQQMLGETVPKSPADPNPIKKPEISAAARQFETAARKANPAPTDPQKLAGNYRKGKTRWQGFGLSIENAKGSERSGKGSDGKAWSVTMPGHYGYILGTKGADRDQVDFYMGDNPESDFVLVADQKDADTGEWDEHKAILGTANATEALDLYKAGFSDGRGADRIGGVRKMNAAEFKEWVKSGDTTKPASAKFRGQVKRAKGSAREKPPAAGRGERRTT